MKLLVIGGAGYIGTALIETLVKHGYAVEAVDPCWFGNHIAKTVKLAKKDAFRLTVDDLSKYSQIIFLAGVSSDSMASYAPSKNFIYNSALPVYVSYLAKKAGVKRFIYASSCSIYESASSQPCKESAKVKPTNVYALSKLQAEFGLQLLSDQYYSVISLRLGTVSGYSPRMRFDLAINTMFYTSVAKHTIFVNDPQTLRPILDIRDACSAFQKAIIAPYNVNGVFNIASGNFTVGDLANVVRTELERLLRNKIKIRISDKTEKRSYHVSTKKAHKTLKFAPRFTISDTVEDLFNHLYKYADMNSDNYFNIKIFKKKFG